MATFPFGTCETVSATGLAQPVSASINVASCAVVFYYFTKNKSALLLAVFFFQAFHAFSHSVHIPGAMHTNVAHALAYLVNAALLYVGYRRTGLYPSSFILGLVVSDLHAFFTLPLFYYVVTQAALFLALAAFYAPLLAVRVSPLAATAAVILLLVLNEKHHCDQMLAAYPTIPFHALIESAGLVFFFLVSKSFYKI